MKEEGYAKGNLVVQGDHIVDSFLIIEQEVDFLMGWNLNIYLNDGLLTFPFD
jgi:hypothetical protein